MNTTERSTILAFPRASLRAAIWFVSVKCPASPHYTLDDICDVILPAYWSYASELGVDPVIALAQCLHETDYLRSFWSARPQRNPAGIGVNGQSQIDRPRLVDGWAYNPDRNRWEQGVSFDTWKDDAIPAHIGRLLAYALPFGRGTRPQLDAIGRAMKYRTLPRPVFGGAPILKQLGRVHNPSGQGWASPGATYGTRIAAIANLIIASEPR